MTYGHACLESEGKYSRTKKADQVADRIQKAIGIQNNSECLNALEIGCGSGHLSVRLGQMSWVKTVAAFDVFDQRTVRFDGKTHFYKAEPGEPLPLESNQFDLVVMNQVFEHVYPDHKLKLLKEISRVLAPNGILWLAFPNKYNPIEPHYRLPLLSWFPQNIADKYLSIFTKHKVFDCYPLSYNQSFALVGQEFSTVASQTFSTILHALGFRNQFKSDGSISRVISAISPTLVFVAKK